MHTSSIELMKSLLDRFAVLGGRTVLELGSQIIPGQEEIGCYRDLIKDKGCKFIGADISSGINVDLVLNDGYRFPFKDNEFDLIISGQTMEHMEFPWVWLTEVKRILKRGGMAIIIAPSKTHEHRHPIDTFRYFRDGMIALAKWTGLEVVEAGRVSGDTYLVAKK